MVSYVDNKTAVRVKPPKNPVFSEAVLWFTDALGSTPTIPQADWFNMIQAELIGIAEAFGVKPDKLDDGQLGTAIIEAFNKVNADISKLPKVLDDFGESRKDAASQRLVTILRDKIQDSYSSKQNRAFARFMKKLKVAGGAKINCVGTSNTSKNKGYISYPESLDAALNDIFRNNVSVVNMGISGGTVSSNIKRWKDNTPEADLTIMEFTANDQSKTEIGQFVNDLEEYIEYELDNDRAVLLMTAPKMDKTTNINRDVYSAAMYGIANKYSMYILDAEKLFANYPTDIHYDGTHTNDLGGTVLGYKIAAVFAGEGIHNPRTVSNGSTLLGRPTLDSLIFSPNTRQYQGSERDPITPNELDAEKGVTANFDAENGTAYLYYAFYAESDNLYIAPNIKLYAGVEVTFTLDGGTISPKYSLSNARSVDKSIKISKDNTYVYKNKSTEIVHSSDENNLIGSIPLVTSGWHLLKIEVKNDVAVLYGLEFNTAKQQEFLNYGLGYRSKTVTLEYLFNAPATGLYYTLDTDPKYIDLVPEGRSSAYVFVEKFTDSYIKLTWSQAIHNRNTYEIRKIEGNWQPPIKLYGSGNSTISKGGFLRAFGDKEPITTNNLSHKYSLLDTKFNTTYTNKSSLPLTLLVSVERSRSNSATSLFVDDNEIVLYDYVSAASSDIPPAGFLAFTFIIPPSSTYKFTFKESGPILKVHAY